MVARRRRTKKKPPFGIPREIILLTGRDEWPYTFIADDAGGGCGKIPMPADAALEDVQAAVVTSLADLTRTFHSVEIDIAWSPLTPNSWVGRISSIAAAESPPAGGAPGHG
ncbi:hypothetical protein ACODT5_45240 [Streptomyces sp. 5.8]|uniref:hypothetical protein n=1 Tax=Streptomyces sp. 5.8 TaxID=3406571 RepID=UPI003BB581CD